MRRSRNFSTILPRRRSTTTSRPTTMDYRISARTTNQKSKLHPLPSKTKRKIRNRKKSTQKRIHKRLQFYQRQSTSLNIQPRKNLLLHKLPTPPMRQPRNLFKRLPNLLIPSLQIRICRNNRKRPRRLRIN